MVGATSTMGLAAGVAVWPETSARLPKITARTVIHDLGLINPFRSSSPGELLLIDRWEKTWEDSNQAVSCLTVVLPEASNCEVNIDGRVGRTPCLAGS